MPMVLNAKPLISNGGTGRGDFSTSWDNRWDGAVTRQDKSYTCEFSIPFSTLRYNSGIKKWQFNSYRFDPQGNERTTWNHVPRNQRMWGTAYMGDMIFEDPPTSTGPNITIIPYVTGGINKDFVEAQPTDFTGNVGTDAKVSVTPGLNLDLTVNPDFSQVEVDEQITNLTRFEISLPERRQFFTENADLFGSFGNRSANPVFFPADRSWRRCKYWLIHSKSYSVWSPTEWQDNQPVAGRIIKYANSESRPQWLTFHKLYGGRPAAKII